MSDGSESTVERYHLVRRLGSGAFGTVYLARDLFLEEDVAVKMPINPPPDLAIALQEPRLLNRVKSPHIVALRDIEQIQGVICLVMEYVGGGSIRARMGVFGRGNSLPPAFAIDVITGVLSALQAAHSLGVLHRDIKPDNVLLTEEGQAKVTDFGIARIVQAAGGIDRTMQPVGTMLYMSPESLRGEVSADADLWATAVMFYEMLAGKHPFPGPSTADLFHQVMNGEPVPFEQSNPEVDPKLAAIVCRALHKDRRQRFPDAASFAAALEGGMKNRPSPAPVTRVEPVRGDAPTQRLFDDTIANAPPEELPALAERIRARLAESPGTPGYHRALGDVYRRMNDDAAAWDEYERAFVIDHTDRRAAEGIADLGLRLRRPERTIQALLALVDIEPRNPSFRRRLAMALEQKGDRDKAIAHMKKSLEIEPDQPHSKRILRQWETGPARNRGR